MFAHRSCKKNVQKYFHLPKIKKRKEKRQAASDLLQTGLNLVPLEGAGSILPPLYRHTFPSPPPSIPTDTHEQQS